MKKSLLFAAMGLVGLSAAAQAVDPAVYAPKDGYTLTNLWLMARGNGQTDGVARAHWMALEPHMANPGKATFATRLGDKVYITCNQSYGVGDDGAQVIEDYHHLIVLDAETGKFIKEMPLTIDGQQSYGLIAANCIGVDDFGHMWITPYVDPTYKTEGTEVTAKPLPLYQVNPETGEMTKITEFVLDAVEGPFGGGRVDFCDVAGDITREKARCVFLSIPNIAAVCLWHCEQGSDEWDIDVTEDAEYCVVLPEETIPAEMLEWGISPLGSFVKDDEFSGTYFYLEGHNTQPVLYSRDGEIIDSLKSHTPDKEATAEEDPWVGFMPTNSANGTRQFKVGDQEFLAYSMTFPNDTDYGGEIAIVKLDENGTLAEATPMWVAPQGKLGNKKGEGRFAEAICVSPEMTDANGKKAVEILIYKDYNGIGMYQLAEEGYQGKGINDAVAEINANGPAKFFNLNGVEVNENNLTAGIYVTLQGGVAKKVVIR